MLWRRRSIDRSLYIPQEIIEEEVLTLLPVKSLLRFKCVSKSWLRLIGSQRFIKIHLQKSRDDKTFSHWRVIFKEKMEHERALVQCSKRSFMEESAIHPSPIEDPTNNNRPLSGRVVDSYDGVLCIFREELVSFTLFNPATRIFHQLPHLDDAVYIYGFGWDETRDAYKVFAVMFDACNNINSRVYSTKTNSWRTIQRMEHGFPFSVGNQRGKFACGKIHWITSDLDHDPRIVTFDLKSEVFGVIELPFEPIRPRMYLHTWLSETEEGCLAVYTDLHKDEGTFDMWVMKEYGVKESWVKDSWRARPENFTSGYKVYSYYESLVSPVPGQHGQTEERMLLQGRHDKASKQLSGFSTFIERLKHKKVCIGCFSSSF